MDNSTRPEQDIGATASLPIALAMQDVEALVRIADGLRSGPTAGAYAPYPRSEELRRLAGAIYRFRRVRDDELGELMFSDPRWDMMLDLYIQEGQGRKVSVSSACVGAVAPATTALRHLGALVHHGFIERRGDPSDARVMLIELTNRGREKLERVLASWTKCNNHLRAPIV